MRRTGIVRDSRFLEHRTGTHHIEVPRRLETIYGMLDRGEVESELTLIPARHASLEEIELVHRPGYVEKILDTAGEPLLYLDPDTVTSEKTCEAAFLAAGGTLECVRSVMSGAVDNAFALVRPPGHHAEQNRQMGFCIFNNIALAAAYARREFSLNRILIVDWDVHHCNGTQHLFDHSNEVLVFSSHRYPFFPGTGSVDEIGFEKGKGFNINVPLSPQKQDAHLIEIFERVLVPVALEFRPQLILVSAGFDAHYDDPIGGMRLSDKGFGSLMGIVLRMADQTCGGKVVAALEGGYDLGALRKSVKAVLKGMVADAHDGPAPPAPESSPVADVIRNVINIHKPYWECFKNV